MEAGIPRAASVLGGFDMTDLDNFADGVPHDVFAVHRREALVLWHEHTGLRRVPLHLRRSAPMPVP